MFTKFVTLSLALVFLVTAQPVQAFVDPPTLDPPRPVAGEHESINVTAGVCDGIGSTPPTITQMGSAVRIVIQSIHSSDSEFCIYPTFTSHFPVGSFEPGAYTLQVDRSYLGDEGLITEVIGTLAFTVASLAGIPALSTWGRALLLFAFLEVALIALRQRRLEVHEN
jgi:hypothetical protein